MNNPSAFPRPFSSDAIAPDAVPGFGDYIAHSDEQDGMTLRDWFAGHAMQGLLSESGCAIATEIADKEGITESQAVASYAFKMADAMLAEREKQP
jgi:hypothetical protein